MTKYGFVSSHNRRRQRSLTDSRNARSDALVNHLVKMDVKRPFQAQFSDITYIRTDVRFAYLCHVRGAYTSMARSHRQQTRMTKDLFLNTLISVQTAGMVQQALSDRKSVV